MPCVQGMPKADHPMTTIKITDASVEPLTLAQAKDHLRETLVDAGNDAYITALITVARQAAEDRLQRTLLETTLQRVLPGFPCSDAIKLSLPSVLSIDWVKYIDASGVEQTLAPTEYSLQPGSEPGQLWPAYGKSWPSHRCQPGAVHVQYKAGYGSTADKVPTPIVQWIKLALTDLYENRARSAERPAVPQQFADSLLDTYRVWSL